MSVSVMTTRSFDDSLTTVTHGSNPTLHTTLEWFGHSCCSAVKSCRSLGWWISLGLNLVTGQAKVMFGCFGTAETPD